VKYGQSYFFLTLKSNGGLVFPSEGVVDVLTTAEHHLRLLDLKKPSVALMKLQISVLSHVGQSDVLHLERHAYDTEDGPDNHSITLIREIVSKYFDLRQHYHVKLQNLQLRKNVRHKLNKTVLFLGQ